MDPVTAMATASAAFGALKKGFAIGRDIESMASDLSRWMGALSDLDQMEKEAKNPPIFKKHTPSLPLWGIYSHVRITTESPLTPSLAHCYPFSIYIYHRNIFEF